KIGVANVRVELRFIDSKEEGQRLEKELIQQFGRINLGTGTLTNLRDGGEGVHSPSPEHREKLKQALLDPSHPIRSPEAIAKLRARMTDPDIKALFLGEANPAKQPETRVKLKAKWADPEYRAMMIAQRRGKPIHSEEEKQRRRERIADNPAMKSWGERNGKDEAFDAKRVAGIRAAQGRRKEKMSDPAALAQRVARLKATMSSPEYLEKRKEWQTPEYRAKLSAAKKAYWERKKAQNI
ncbi:hypothetical protein EBT25_13690, partial [bacterium]|nr:hypothetical protein [bacterium]